MRANPIMVTRAIVAWLIALTMIGHGFAAEPVLPQVDAAVAKGLVYLARQQQADGSFTPLDEQGPRVAPAAGALIAFLSTGQTPANGRHALVVRNAIDFIVRQLPEDGDFGRADSSASKGQALIMTALAEAHGLESDPALRRPIREALERSARFIRMAQHQESGGWANDGRGSGELMTTLWMTLALRAARDAGVEIPDKHFERAAAFVRKCHRQNPAGYADHGGPTISSNTAALSILMLTVPRQGLQAKAALKALDALSQEKAGDFYDMAFAATLGGIFSDDAATISGWRSPLMAKQQAEDGSWAPMNSPPYGLGTVSATSSAVLTLSLPYRLLPVLDKAAPVPSPPH